MAMNASQLKSELKSAINAIDITQGEKANDELLQALSATIVNHIKNNAKAVVVGGSSSGQHNII